MANFGEHIPVERKERKIAICIFNRATYARCKSFIDLASRSGFIKLTVILSSSLLFDEYGNGSTYVQESHENVDFVLLDIGNFKKTHKGMCDASQVIIQKFSEYFSGQNFDAIISVADRFETLPVSLVAAYLSIPLIHIQGGEITGNIDEKVRHSVTKLADLHFVCTKLAKQYVVRMGEENSRVIRTGCPSLDIIHKNRIKRKSPQNYIICMFHPETENIDEAEEQINTIMKSVVDYCAKTRSKSFVYWPNPDPGREKIVDALNTWEKEYPKTIIKAVNEEPVAFLTRLARARFIIGNSSCGLRETSFIGVPSINVGGRQNLRERSWNVLDVGYNEEEISKAMSHQHTVGGYARSCLYGNGRAAQEMITALAAFQYTKKGGLNYPELPKYYKLHLGEERFDEHRHFRTTHYRR